MMSQDEPLRKPHNHFALWSIEICQDQTHSN